MAQQFIFDPTSEATGTELDVSADPYGVTSFEAPAPSLEASWAGNMDTEGEAPASRKHQNRTVRMTVEVAHTVTATRDAAIDVLAAKVAKIAREGGTLRFVKATGSYRTLDLWSADAYEPTIDIAYSLGQLATVNIGLVAKPYARGAGASVATFTETTLPAAIFTITVGTVTGDTAAAA